MGFTKPVAEESGRTWTEEEENKLLRLFHEEDLPLETVVEKFEDRSHQSLKNKLRKLRKKKGTYDYDHREEKYNVNREWIDLIAEDMGSSLKVFDGYAGRGKSSGLYIRHSSEMTCCEIEDEVFNRLVGFFEKNAGANKVNQDGDRVELSSGETDITCFNENVNDVLHRKVGQRNEYYDFIDLDPCGSPFVSVPQSIRLIKNGYLAITYGDLQLKRWGRHAPLMKAYRMPEVETFREAIGHMIAWTMFEGVRQEKAKDTRRLEVVNIEALPKLNTGVARVLFKVEKTRSLNPTLEYLENELKGDDILTGQFPVEDYID